MLGGNLETVSNIEALPTTRLYRLYFEQSLFEDRASVRLGQIAADDEFITSDTAGGLINGTFGWPAWTAADVRGGGPAYPLPQLGVRLQVKPAADFDLRAAVFTGNPGGKNCPSGDPQQCDPHGVLFPFSGGTLWIGEVAYSANSGKGAAGLPGVYKLGGWYETGPFPVAARPGGRASATMGACTPSSIKGSGGGPAATSRGSISFCAWAARRPTAISSRFTPMPGSVSARRSSAVPTMS